MWINYKEETTILAETCDEMQYLQLYLYWKNYCIKFTERGTKIIESTYLLDLLKGNQIYIIKIITKYYLPTWDTRV